VALATELYYPFTKESLRLAYMATRSKGGMSEAQRQDYEAACDGRITWARYFQTWENGFGL